MKVGELAKKTNLSVRTLHHYDEIGLLRPSSRTESGHRDYSKGDIERLQKIVSLRQIGLSLEEVGEILGKEVLSVLEVIDRHKSHVSAQMEDLKKVYRRLDSTSDYLKAQKDIDVEMILDTIAQVTLFEKYFTEEQFDQLAELKMSMGDEQIRAVEKEWEELIAQAKQAMAKNLKPAAKEVQTIAKRWNELIQMFTMGDPAMMASTQKMYDENPEMAAHYQIDQDLFEFINQATKHLEE